MQCNTRRNRQDQENGLIEMVYFYCVCAAMGLLSTNLGPGSVELGWIFRGSQPKWPSNDGPPNKNEATKWNISMRFFHCWKMHTLYSSIYIIYNILCLTTMQNPMVHHWTHHHLVFVWHITWGRYCKRRDWVRQWNWAGKKQPVYLEPPFGCQIAALKTGLFLVDFFGPLEFMFIIGRMGGFKTPWDWGPP